jgi:hypothetical protein
MILKSVEHEKNTFSTVSVFRPFSTLPCSYHARQHERLKRVRTHMDCREVLLIRHAEPLTGDGAERSCPNNDILASLVLNIALGFTSSFKIIYGLFEPRFQLYCWLPFQNTLS